MTCTECSSNSATYISKCIGCTARWILRHEKDKRLAMIENNGIFDIDLLKQAVINLNKEK